MRSTSSFASTSSLSCAHLIKDAEFRDNPPNPAFLPGRPPHERLLPLYTTDRPEVHDVVAGLRQVIDEFDDRVLIGEIYLPIDRLVAYYGADLRGAHLPFNFALPFTPGRRATSTASSPNTRPRFRSAPGPIGCWAITTGPASRVGSDATRRGSPRCCC
jgi:hypothetical protein